MSEVEIYCIKSSFISANVWLLNTKSSIKPLKLKEMTNLLFSHLRITKTYLFRDFVLKS